MEDLIKALQIFLKYTKDKYPTACEHDVLYVHCKPELVSDEDKVKLEKLGFSPDKEVGGFRSYRYGSS